MRSVAPGAAARMADLIFAKSPRASFGHLAIYLTTPLLLRFFNIAFSACCSVFCENRHGDGSKGRKWGHQAVDEVTLHNG